LPVVLLTGVSEGPLIDRAREYQVNEILQKGKVTLDEIVGAARKVLGRGEVRPSP
jgi:DNA-binding NarL/FixJ family response regulator